MKSFLIISELWINWIRNKLKRTMNEVWVLARATHEYMLHMNRYTWTKNLQFMCKIKCNKCIYACTPNDKDVIKIFMIQMLIRRLGVWTCCQILNPYGTFLQVNAWEVKWFIFVMIFLVFIILILFQFFLTKHIILKFSIELLF